MIRHTVFFRFQPDAAVADRTRMAEGLASLPGKIGVIRKWSQGMNCIPSERNYDFCLIGDFDSLDDLQTYQDHPAHQDVVNRLVRPIAAGVAAVDFEA